MPYEQIFHEIFQITSVNNHEVSRWQDVRIEILNNIMNDKKILLTLQDKYNEKIMYPIKYDPSILNMEGDIIQNIGLNISYPNNDSIIGTVSGKQNNKNIKTGDKIISINETPIKSWTNLVEYIHAHPDTSINIVAERMNERVEYTAMILNKNNIGFFDGISNLVNKTINTRNTNIETINNKRINTPLVGSLANAWTETKTPDRTKNVPSRLSINVRIERIIVQFIKILFLSATTIV